MFLPFIFSSPVTGKDFVGRKGDVTLLSGCISRGRGAVVYGEPLTGCKSLVRETLAVLRAASQSIVPVEIDFLRVRTGEDVLRIYAEGFSGAFRKAGGSGLPENVPLDAEKVFSLPAGLASLTGSRVVVLVNEFQNILNAENHEVMLRCMESRMENETAPVCHIFSGSQFNRLREIFDVRRFFWPAVTRIRPSAIDVPALTNYVYRKFLDQGKVLGKDVISGVVSTLKGNPGYVTRFFSIIDAVSKGYVTDTAIRDGFKSMLDAERHRFVSYVSELTDYQLELLKAVIDGETHLCSAAVIERYGLNSSANVKRLKEALAKKEIVWFDDNDVPHIEDALFELWLRKEYFVL